MLLVSDTVGIRARNETERVDIINVVRDKQYHLDKDYSQRRSFA